MDKTKFDKAIELHKRHSRIYFEKIKETDNEIIIRVKQTRSPAENYSSKEELDQIGKDTFGLLKTGKNIIVHSDPYKVAPSEVVSVEWIKCEMQTKHIRLKRLSEDLGISKSDLSATINGHKDFGIRTKNMFYYYFKSLEHV